VFLAGFGLLYSLTAARTIQWQDSGQFVLRIVSGQLHNELGLALSHPLHYWLGSGAISALPLTPPHAIALVSALFGALTVANVFGCSLTLTRRAIPAALAAGGLGVAHTFWRMSTIPECYTITTALLAAELWCLALYLRRRKARWAIAMALANGLGLANHNLALLTLPLVGLIGLDVLRHAHWRNVGPALAMAGMWLLGSLPFTGLVIMQMAQSGEVMATVRSALFGDHYAEDVLSAAPSVFLLVVSLAFTALSFANLTLPAAAAGILRGRRQLQPQAVFWALLAALGLHLAFVLRYTVIDQYTFFLPTYTILALFAAVGFALPALTASATRRRWVWGIALTLLLLTPLVYVTAPPLARQVAALDAVARHKPYRDDYHYLFTPWAVALTSAERMSERAVELAKPNGVIVAEDNMGAFAIRYQVRQRRLQDVRIVATLHAEDVAQAQAKNAPIICVPADRRSPQTPAPTGRWQRVGDLYQLATE
jgi:hypothetical protein